MAAPVKKAPVKKGLDVKGALTRKYGPLPAWAWLGTVAVALFVWRRRKGAAAPSASSASIDTSGSGSSGGAGDSGAGGGGGGPQDSTPTSAPVSWDPAQFAAEVAADLNLPTTTNDGQGTSSSPASNPDASMPSKQKSGAKVDPVTTASPVLSAGGKVVTKVAAGTTLISEPPTRANPGPNLQIAVPPGATNIHKTPQGAVIYTAASGAVLEQAPGHSRYTVSKAPVHK